MAEKETLAGARAAVKEIRSPGLRFAAAVDLYEATSDVQDLEWARVALAVMQGPEEQCQASVELFRRSQVSADLTYAFNGLRHVPGGYTKGKVVVAVVSVLAAAGYPRLARQVAESIPSDEGSQYFRDRANSAVAMGYVARGKSDMARQLALAIHDKSQRACVWRAVFFHSRAPDDLFHAERAAEAWGTPGEMVAVRETEVDAWLAVGDEPRAATAAQKGATPEIRARLYHRILQHRTP